MKYKIYHMPGVKIGVSTNPKRRVQRQGYSEYEILEEHSCIYTVSDREQELQKEYGYKVDKCPYYISYKKWKQNSKNLNNEMRSRGGRTNAKSGHCARISKLGGLSNVKSGHIYRLQKIGTLIATEKNKKPIIKLDKNNNIIEEYSSIKEASIKNNRTQSTISNNLNGRTKYCGGFKYVFKD